MTVDTLANLVYSQVVAPHVIGDGQISVASVAGFLVGTRVTALLPGAGQYTERIAFIANVASIDATNKILHLGSFLEGTSDAALSTACTVEIRFTAGHYNELAAEIVGGSGVTSVNTRTGNVTLVGTDVPAFVASGSSHAPGAVPDPGSSSGTTHFLREDATWSLPPVTSVAGKTGAVTLTYTDVGGSAPLASPTFTGTPAAPTPALSDSSTAVATTSFVKGQGYLTSAPVTSVAGKTGSVTLVEADVTNLTTDLSSKALPLVPTGVKTAGYSASAQDFVPVDTTSGSVTITLPNGPSDRALVGVKQVVQGGSNTVSVVTQGSDVFNRSGGSTSLTVSLASQGALLQYSASPKIWYVLSDDLPLGSLDGRYLASTTTLVNTVNTRSGAVTLGGTDVPVFVASGASHAQGTVPDPGSTAGATRVLREDATWVNPMAYSYFFGGGQDGSTTISGSTTTLTRDMFYNNLTITTGTFQTSGYRVFVAGTLDISAAGTGSILSGPGAVGGNSGSQTGASGGSGASNPSTNSSLSGSQSGTSGGNGVASGAATAATALATQASYNSNNGAAGTGGAGGGASGGSGGAGGANATGVVVPFIYTYSPQPIYFSAGTATGVHPSQGGSGGGGGNGDGTNQGGGGGGGGSSGGWLWLSAATIARGTNTNASIFQAKGANGGNGSSPSAGNTAGGGGGGGGSGGTIFVYYGALTGSQISNCLDASSGAGGNAGVGHNTGGAGTGGKSGYGGLIQAMNLSTGVVTVTNGGAVNGPTGTTTGGVSVTTQQAL